MKQSLRGYLVKPVVLIKLLCCIVNCHFSKFFGFMFSAYSQSLFDLSF